MRSRRVVESNPPHDHCANGQVHNQRPGVSEYICRHGVVENYLRYHRPIAHGICFCRSFGRLWYQKFEQEAEGMVLSLLQGSGHEVSFNMADHAVLVKDSADLLISTCKTFLVHR